MTPAGTNRLLNSLTSESRNLILAASKPVILPLKRPFYIPENAPQNACFITSGLASIVATTEDGDTAEVGIIGKDGFVGAAHMIGPAVVSTSSFMQMEGAGIEVPFSHLQELFHSSTEIRGRILEFVQEQLLTVSQVAACNRMHDVEARLARWMLMAQDRTESDVLIFTQEFLGMMLGSRRTTVTLVAGTLQRLGYIEYSRGRVRILDRPALEDAACDCYQITKKLQAGLYADSQAGK
jgi:CRP-like cAMP-binding protein